MWGKIVQVLLKGLGVVASGAAAYGGYTIAENLISSGGAQETASASTEAVSSGSASGINIGALLTCLAIAGVVTLIIYLIKRKR